MIADDPLDRRDAVTRSQCLLRRRSPSVGLALSLCLSLASTSAALPGDIDLDERVELFPTFACVQPDGIDVSLRGWVYEPEYDSLRRRAALASLRRSLGLDEPGSESADRVFARRARAFLVDNERGERVTIEIAKQRLTAPRTDAGGHFVGSWRLDKALVREALGLAVDAPIVSGTLTARVVLGPGDPRRFETRVTLVGRQGWSVISDIDDTLKISDVNDTAALLRRTFEEEFQPVEGMPELLRSMQRGPTTFHYVSASPWQLASELDPFLNAAGFPAGSLELRRLRAFDDSFFELFADPTEFKSAALARIVSSQPGRRFILIGDSAERDPECYGELARRVDAVRLVLIRRVGSLDPDRFQRAFREVSPDRWLVFDDPAAASERVATVQITEDA